MPKRFFEYSRTEPARTILFSVAVLTMIAQGIALAVTPPLHEPLEFLPLVVVAILCFVAVRSSYLNDISGMSRWSFALFVVWLWGAFVRFAFTDDPLQLLWVPMLIVAITLAVIHIHVQGLRKGGDNV